MARPAAHAALRAPTRLQAQPPPPERGRVMNN
ncbi:hypothetical protein ANO14919_047720 [Xylariales sp. No.14919]|nr:hypothetical protein ANO14919_047720 [Xylariales sp. No.14919]